MAIMAPKFEHLEEYGLASSWIHAMLFTVELIFVVRYFQKFSLDGPRRFHCVVSLLVINSLVALMATAARSWKLLIGHRTGPPPEIQPWPLPLMVICNTVAAMIEQSFLLYRYYGLSRNLFWTAVVLLLIGAHSTFGFMRAIGFVTVDSVVKLDRSLVTTFSYCFSAGVDITIPTLLIWELRKIKTSYSCTQSLIRRVIVNAASAGCTVALCEILILVLFWTVPSAICLFNAALGPLYGITVLVNLFVCQRKVPCPTPSQTKTGNLTTSVGFDAFQPQQSPNLPHLYQRDKSTFNPQLSDIESMSSKEVSSTDYASGSDSPRPSGVA